MCQPFSGSSTQTGPFEASRNGTASKGPHLVDIEIHGRICEALPTRRARASCAAVTTGRCENCPGPTAQSGACRKTVCHWPSAHSANVQGECIGATIHHAEAVGFSASMAPDPLEATGPARGLRLCARPHDGRPGLPAQTQPRAHHEQRPGQDHFPPRHTDRYADQHDDGRRQGEPTEPSQVPPFLDSPWPRCQRCRQTSGA